jgi:glutamyl-tRNA synthetase
VRDRATFAGDMWELSSFLFHAPEEYEKKAVEKFWKGENPARLAAARDALAAIGDFTAGNIEHALHSLIESNEWPMGQVMNTLRLAVVGASKGPGMADICELTGREGTLARIDRALRLL